MLVSVVKSSTSGLSVPLLCAGEGSAFLSFRKGDLIQLDNDDGEDVMKSGWCYGTCTRTGAHGDFPAECVYVLPTINKPTQDILVSSHTFV